MIMMMMMTMMLMMVMNFQCKEIQFNDLNASENIDQGLALRAHAQIPGVVFVFLFGCFCAPYSHRYHQTFGWLQWNPILFLRMPLAFEGTNANYCGKIIKSRR